MYPIDFNQLNGAPKGREFWCMMANARKGQREAIINQNMEAFAYFSGALGAYVDVLGLAAPDDIRPDGSETAKP